MSKTYKLFGWVVVVNISKPNTTWWDNDWSPKGKYLRARSEHLLSFERVYFRTVRLYGYKIILGRLCISMAKLGKVNLPV